MSNFCFHFYTLEILSSIVLQVSWLFYILKINYEKLWIRQGNAPTEIKQLKPFWFIKHSSTVKKTPNISTYKNITLLRQFTPSKATDTFSITKRTENRSYNWSKNRDQNITSSAPKNIFPSKNSHINSRPKIPCGIYRVSVVNSKRLANDYHQDSNYNRHKTWWDFHFRLSVGHGVD